MSGATSRRKGNKAEVDVVKTLRSHGYVAETSRNARGGTQKGEDIVTDLPVSIEVKNHTKIDLAGWWRQAEAQADGQPAIIVHKRVGTTDPNQWWVTTNLGTFIRIIKGRTND